MRFQLFLVIFLIPLVTKTTEISNSNQQASAQGNVFSTHLIPVQTVNVRGYNGQYHPISKIPYCSTNSSISFGSYPPTLCPDGDIGLSPGAVNFMNANFNKCVAYGLKEIGIRRPFKRVKIFGQGGAFKKRSNGTISNHTSGDAIDINHLQIEFNNGQSAVFPASAVDYNGVPFEGFFRCEENCLNPETGKQRRWNMTGKAIFYEKFRYCLEQAVALEHAKFPGQQCSGGPLGCNDDSSHDNHMHFSFPVCPRMKGFKVK